MLIFPVLAYGCPYFRVSPVPGELAIFGDLRANPCLAVPPRNLRCRYTSELRLLESRPNRRLRGSSFAPRQSFKQAWLCSRLGIG